MNPHTCKSIPIVLLRGDCKAHGTGFLYRHKNKDYFITAWHNLSGRHFVTKKPLHKMGWLPNEIQMNIPIETSLMDGQQIAYNKLTFRSQLYTDDDETLPIWLVDSKNGSEFDIAVIPLSKFSKGNLIKREVDRSQMSELINQLDGTPDFHSVSFSEDPIRITSYKKTAAINSLSVGLDVFIIGYPRLMTDSHGLPIWKRGSVASEPLYDLNGRSCFLIDSTTKEGMSGAPVIVSFDQPSFQIPSGVFNEAGDVRKGGILTRATGDPELVFCGLYSARLFDDAENAQLGIVWRREAIENVIENGVRGVAASDFNKLLDEGGNKLII